MKDEYKFYSEDYDKTHNEEITHNMYREWLEELELAIKKHKVRVKTLIDLGCGTGITTIPWLNKGYRVIGVEISKAMLNVAKKKSAKVKWINQDIINLDINEKADAVTCHFDVINHLLKKRDVQKTFNNVYNLLNPKGLFIFDIMSEESFSWLKKIKRKHTLTEKAYSKKEIKEMLIKSGFKILRIRRQKTPEWDGKPRRWIFLVKKR